MGSVAQRWFGAFMETVKTHEASTTLREAAERGELMDSLVNRLGAAAGRRFCRPVS